MRTSFIICLALIAAVTGLTACGKSGQSPTTASVTPTAAIDTTTTVDGDWVVQQLLHEPAHLNPLTSTEGYSQTVNGSIFESLIERDNETLAIKPLLAERWEISEDHLNYTFFLRKNVKFSDGVPLTAKDVKFTFDKLMDPTTDAPQLRNYFQDVTNCEMIDDYTIRFTCSKPYFKHLTMLGGLSIIPEHIYSQGDFNTSPYNRKPVGSGPYMFESWETSTRITLTRNENYWREKPHLLKNVYTLVTDYNAAFQLLERQDMDAMNLTPELYIKRADNDAFRSNFEIYTYNSTVYRYIGWNLRRPQFEDKRVRQAMTMLLDRKLILETIYYGLGIEVTGEFFVDSPEYDMTIEPLPYDPEGAVKLLNEAGWTDSDGDGVLDKDGVKFEFEILMRTGDPDEEATATFFQEALKREGIIANIRSLEFASMLARVDERNFDAVMLRWGTPPIEGDPYQIWHSSQIAKGSNYVGYNNPEIDKICEEGRLEFDEQKRIEMYHRFSRMLYEDQPYTFLFRTKDLVAVAKRFHGVKAYKFGLDSREWWVPAELQRYK